MAKTETFERNKTASDARMKEAADLLRAIETREKLAAGRERRADRTEEEQALEDLTHGADAATQDEAEAAAAATEARENDRSARPVAGLTAAAKTECLPARVEGITDSPPAGPHALPGRATTPAAKKKTCGAENPTWPSKKPPSATARPSSSPASGSWSGRKSPRSGWPGTGKRRSTRRMRGSRRRGKIWGSGSGR